MKAGIKVFGWALVLAFVATGFGIAAEESDDAYVGTWIIKATSPMGEINSVLVIEPSGEGWHGMPDSEHNYALRDYVVNDDGVSLGLTMFIKEMGKMSLDFRGSTSGDTLTGGLYLPGSPAEIAEVNGTRATERDVAEFLARVAVEGASRRTEVTPTTPAPTGDYSVTISVNKFNGDSVSGKNFILLYEHFQKSPFVVASGTVPSSGILEFSGLNGGDAADAHYELAVDDEVFPRTSPKTSFYLDGEERHRRVDLVLSCTIGDQAPNFRVVDAATGKPVELASLRGQVVFLDFWASWCPPCQEPMAHNNELLMRRKDWAGKATILAISVDSAPEAARDHMVTKGWTNVPSYWAPEEPGAGVAFLSKVAQDYTIEGIPTTILIDQNGIIRARGNDLDPESLIDSLLGG